MMRNIKITTSSILSIIIIIGLVFIFGSIFLIILGIFFITKLYNLFFKKKKTDTMQAKKSNTESEADIVDVEKDDYKID
jgi:cbb3-type cytochrome oxidase subunit 3